MADKKTTQVGRAVFSATSKATQHGGTSVELTEQLVYLGQDGVRFVLGYRESADGRAREAFSEDAIYQVPLNGEPTEIAFRNARVKIYSVSNSNIEYEDVGQQTGI